ncbi:MAG: hypothetical protein F4111_03470 [Acidimicrobiales bacterium]|nr:hypothetical protein [Acidimicrobiales bacterium]
MPALLRLALRRPARPVRALLAPLLLAPLLVLVPPSGSASAQSLTDVTVVSHTWPLVPEGLDTGDRFRLLLQTNQERDAQSSDISVYNTWVQEQVAAGHSAVRQYADLFRAVGCTSSVSAVANTGMSGSTAPIYWLNGGRAAASAAAFFTRSPWERQAFEDHRDEHGDAPTGNTRVLYGCHANGTGWGDFELGTPPPGIVVAGGHQNDSTKSPLEDAVAYTATRTHRMYAVSQVFEVGPPPNEAATVVPHSWPLVPDDLGPGDQFRLLFLTDASRNSQSSDISVYNRWVQTQAAGSNAHPAIRNYSNQFRAVGSTRTVHAVNNTGMSGSTAPIYWLNGDRVADTAAAFFSGTRWQHQAKADYRWERGEGFPASQSHLALTGTSISGTRLDTWELGSTHGRSSVLVPTDDDRSMWGGSHQLSVTLGESFRMLAVSLVFEVGPLPSEVTYVSEDWPLVPDGLEPGDRFRLMFLTSNTINGQSTDITAYNAHAQSAARGSRAHASLRAYAHGFSALVSTVETGARANAAMGGAGGGIGVWWLGGKKVAGSYSDFYDGTWTNNTAADLREESGNQYDFSTRSPGGRFIYSGTTSAGEPSSAEWGELGTATPGVIKWDDGNRARALAPTGHVQASLAFPVHAISGVLQVARAAVPDADGTYTVPADWPLRPAGVAAGGKFRLLFVTSQARDGIAADVASYNGFVQRAAGRGHPALRHYTEGFAALVSTADVDARDNTATTGTGVPIYWTRGGKVADDYADFYDGTWASRAWRDEHGSYNGALGRRLIWTGSADDGTEDSALSGLGTGQRSATAWVSAGPAQSPFKVRSDRHSASHLLYGVSPVFKVAAAASAPQTVPADWPLLPAGVGPGEQFRLIFITTGQRDAASSDIGDYNAFVRDAAAAGHPALDSLAGGMTSTVAEGITALVSTADVDARDNTATTGTGVPIYWTGGAKVADDYADFYDGSWAAAGAGQRRTEHAEGVSGVFEMWTGSSENGVEDGSVQGGLGAGTQSAVARSGLAGFRPLQRVALWDNTRSARLYGLSEVLEVAGWTMPTTSTYLPSGISEGDRFRLLFVTRTQRNGASSNIGDYNKFVQDAAKTNADLAAIADSFRAIGSTYAVSARDNTDTRGTGVPIYWVNGIKVADDYADLYGAPWASGSARFPDGGVVTDPHFQWVFTGTSNDGRRSNAYLGSDEVSVGHLGVPGSTLSATSLDRNAERTMYGLSAVLTAVEPAGPAASVTAGTSPVTEGANAAFTITLAEAPSTGFSLAYEITQQGDVYGGGSLGTKHLPIVVGATTVSLNIPTADDMVDEADGSLTVTIVEGDGYTVGDPASASVAVSDDDATSVALSVPDRLLSEGDSSATGTLRLTVSRALASGESLGVPLAFSGGAVGTDVSLALSGSPTGVALSGSTVTFTGPSAVSADVTVTAAGDVDASNERVSVSIPATSASGSPKLTETGLGTVTGAQPDNPWLLIDDDDETVTDPATQQVPSDWSLVPSGLSAGDRFRLLFISSAKRRPTSADIADYNAFVQARAAAGHAGIQSYSDGFRAVASSPFVDASANTATASTDTDAQIWWLGGPKAADDYADFWDGTWDNEADGASGDWRTEAGSAPTLTVYDLPATGTASGGAKHATAHLGTVTPTSGSLKVAMGNPGRSGGPVDGGLTNVLDPWSYRMYGLSQVFVVVPTAQFASAAYSAGEASGSRSRDITVNLSSAAPAGGLTLSYDVGGTATAGSDYTALSGTVTVAASATSATITVTVLDDAVDDDDETVVLTLTDGTGYAVGTRSETTLTITDDDDPPAVDVTFAVESSTALEGSTARFRATLQNGAVAPAGGLVLPITVNAAPAQSTDASSADYGTKPTQIVIAPGQTRASAALSVADDALDELRERIRFAPGTLPTGYQVTGGTFNAASGRVTIRDGDATVVSLSGGGTVTEGDTTTSTTVTVSLSRALRNDPLNSGTESLSVPLTLTESGAARGSQYTMSCPSSLPTGVTCSGLTSGTPTVTFTGSASAASSVAVTFTGGPTADSDTASGSVGVSLGSLSASRMDGGAAKHGTSSSASVAVTDATPSASPTASVTAGAGVTEGTAAGFTVSVSPAPTGTDTVTVHYTVGHTGGDYVTAANRGAKSVVVDSSGSAAVSVPTQADSVDEPNGSVKVTVNADSAYDVSGSAGSASVSVSDDDATSVALSLPDRLLSEGDSSATGTLRLTVSRALASGESLGVPLAFSGGAVGTDVSLALSGSPTGVALSGSTVTFTGPSAVSADVTVTAAGDVDASNERVSVSIPATSASGSPKLTETGLGTVTGAQPDNPWLLIDDDDETVTDPATQQVPSDWSLVPSGLSAGDRFRLLFISSAKRRPTSADIADYNAFVQARAAAGHAGIQSYSDGFRAVASSPFVDASANTATASTDTDAQIWWLGGPKAADDYADFWDGTWDNEADGASGDWRTEAGSAPTLTVYDLPATGTASGGAKHATAHLGTVTPTSGSLKVAMGNPGRSGGPVDGGLTNVLDPWSYRMYGLSQVFEVATPSSTPEAQFASAAYSAGEASGNRSADVTVSLSSAAPAGGLTLSYSVGGTATAGSDYTALSGTVTVAANTSSATITVTVLDDSTAEGNETVELTLTGGSGYTVSTTAGTATVTISDDDSVSLPTVSVTGGAGVTEGTAAAFTVSVSPAPTGTDTVTVQYTVSQSGSFVASGDLGAKQVQVGSSGSASVSVPTEADGTVEANGSVTVTVDADAAYTVSSTAGSATVDVADDDGTLPVLSLEPGSVATEGSAAYFSVIAKPSVSGTLSVSYTVTQSGSFVASGDLGSQSLSVSGGFTGFAVPTVGDSTDETSGSVTVTLDAGSGYTVDADAASSTVLVLDDDGATEVTVAPAAAEVDEGFDAEVVVYVRPKPVVPVDIPLTLTLGTAEAGDVGSVGAASLAKGDLQQRVTVSTRADADADDDTFAVGIGSPLPAGYVAGAHSTAGFTVVDTGTTVGGDPELSIAAGAQVVEGTAASFTVSASPAPSGSLTVSYSVAQTGSYVSAGDRGSQSVSLDLSGGTATVTVPTQADTADEPNGTVTVTLSSGTGYTVSGTAGAATVDVTDDDLPPLPQVSAAAGTSPVTEGAAASFTLTASPSPSSPLTVNYRVTQSGDYVSGTSTPYDRTVTIPTSGSATVSVPTSDDAADESDGSVTVTVRSGGGYTAHNSNGAATVNVSDNDVDPNQPQLTLARTAASVAEGAAAGFTVTASPAPSGTLTVRYHISQSGDWLTGTAGTTSASLDLSSGTATISVATDDDSADESDGSVTVTLLTGSGYSVGSPGTQTVAVTDNDVGTTTTVDPGGNGNGGGGGVSPGPRDGPAPAADERERSEAVVVLADGWSPPDIGAAAAYAARTPHAVVLYTDTRRLSGATREFLADALPARIVVVGGADAVTDTAVRTARRAAGLRAADVTRMAGDDRSATAAAAARAALGEPARVGGAVTVVIANGWSPPDIGAAAALAARTPRSAVLYTYPDRLPAAAADVLADYRPPRIVIVGGTAAVTEAAAEAVRNVVPASALERIAGADRADTAAQTARRALGDPARAYNATVVIANGWSPSDIGAAAALAARTPRSAVLYTRSDRLPAAAQAVLAEYQPANVIVIGGNAAIAPSVAESIGDHAPNARRQRITGTDRTETAANTAERALADP